MEVKDMKVEEAPATLDEKVNYLIDRVDELFDLLEGMSESQENLITKVDELNLPSGSGFGIQEFES